MFSKESRTKTGRSSRQWVFCRKGALGKFSKFIEKHLCQSFFFNKVAGLRPANLLKKRPWHMYFPVSFAKLLRTPFLNKTPLVAAFETMRLSGINALFSCKKVFGATKIQKQPS